ncbi:MAG TPA: hypothetical protein VGV87_04810 [Blastocatellia bacterium]|nr:hypothetical protein [Blastocatellia bacterium]
MAVSLLEANSAKIGVLGDVYAPGVLVMVGDTVVVHGNLFKKITRKSSLVGVTTFITFLTRGGRQPARLTACASKGIR